MAFLLVDTCAVIWIANGDRLREPAASVLRGSEVERLVVSSISAWEIATLVAKEKMALSIGPDVWFQRFCELPGVALAEMQPAVLVASASLPGAPPGDPADRILVATARAFGYTLVTRDRKLLEYGRHGHVQVLGC